MSNFLAAWLPHLGAALILANIVLAVCSRWQSNHNLLAAVFAATFAFCLIPFTEFSVSHYFRVLTGDLSVTSLVLFSLVALGTISGRQISGETNRIACVIVATAVLLYPTALGLTYFDLYAFGFYPIILGPTLFVVFAYSLWFDQRLAPVLLGLGFAGFALGILESDNLWDYLIDPVATIYAISLVIRHRSRLPSFRMNPQQIQMFLTLTIATFLLFAVYLSRANHEAFRHEFVIEDGFIEWCTVVVLFCTMLVCGRRFYLLRGRRNALFLSITALLTLFCLFGAGEEISWGQRIFGIETPDYLKDKNAQGELGLHNLVVEINGEEVKLNKLIFGTGLALALLIYLFVATPLYRKNDKVRRFFNAIAAPMPRNFHIIGYLAVVAVVELLIDSSKRGEMTEFAGSIMFAMNVIYPYNPEIFDPEKELNPASPESG